jgi:hypothetical protein
LFFILSAGAVLVDVLWDKADPKEIYGWATTVLGIIVGWLGGEAATT